MVFLRVFVHILPFKYRNSIQITDFLTEITCFCIKNPDNDTQFPIFLIKTPFFLLKTPYFLSKTPIFLLKLPIFPIKPPHFFPQAVRILRPLKSISYFPALRLLISAVLSAVPLLFDVALVLAFAVGGGALLGVGVFGGSGEVEGAWYKSGSLIGKCGS
jgi:hypothetical protein